MAKTFACPHCEASYRALPTLVGRKVRCSSCRNVFQLQHTGVAIKVEVAPKKDVPPQDKAPSQAPSDRKQTDQSATAKKPSRPQTRAIRKKQERLQEMRKSLSGLAAAAEEGVSSSGSAALEPRPSSQSSAKVKAATGKQSAASSGKLNKKNPPKKSLRDSHYVQLNHEGERAQKIKHLCWYALFMVLIILGGIYLLLSQRSSVEKALYAFTAPVDQGVPRLGQYQERLWRAFRHVEGDIPIIVSVEDAQSGNIEEYEWPKVISFLSRHIENRDIHPFLPIWCKSADQKRIDKLWQDYPNKVHISGFYLVLEQAEIQFTKLDQLPSLMASSGMPKWLVYTVSMLLVPGLGEERRQLLFGDSFPLTIKMCIAKGENGHQLIEQNGQVDVLTQPIYNVLLVGFTGLGQEGIEEWRILDVRFDEGMGYYYSGSQNPLYLCSKHMEAALRRLAVSEIDLGTLQEDTVAR